MDQFQSDNVKFRCLKYVSTKQVSEEVNEDLIKVKDEVIDETYEKIELVNHDLKVEDSALYETCPLEIECTAEMDVRKLGLFRRTLSKTFDYQIFVYPNNLTRLIN